MIDVKVGPLRKCNKLLVWLIGGWGGGRTKLISFILFLTFHFYFDRIVFNNTNGYCHKSKKIRPKGVLDRELFPGILGNSPEFLQKSQPIGLISE